MANITGSSTSLSGLQLAPNTILLNTITFVIATFAIILNSTEIHLIRRKWKKATDFEVLLLNLGIVDLISGICFIVIASLGTAALVKKKPKASLYSFLITGILTFFCTVSTKLVIVIGIERLLAIKLPLKHRLWHTSRRTTYKCVSAVWVVSFIIIGTALLSDYFIQKSKGRSPLISHLLAYVLAAYLSLGVCILLVAYAWLSRAVIRRSAKKLNFDQKDYKGNPKAFRRAFKKEKATIIVCRLVAATFLVCNIPTIVALYRGKMNAASVSLTCLNTVINPLIYFFKGYAEKWYAKKKLAVSSSDTGGSNEKLDSPSPKPIMIDPSLELGNLSTESNGKLKPNGQQSEGSKDKGQACLMKYVSPLKMANMYKEKNGKNGDLPNSNGHESGSSRNRGEGPPNNIDLSVEMGKVDKVENGNLSTVYSKGSESSRVKGDEILNTHDVEETNEQSESAKYRGEGQGEKIPNGLNLSVEMGTVNLAGNDDLCIENDQESERLKDKGEDQWDMLLKKLDSFVDVETVKLAGNDDLCTVNGQDLEGSGVKDEGSSDTSDNEVKLSIIDETLSEEMLKTKTAKIMDGHEDTHPPLKMR